jgi:micrococcal nuclease
MRQRALLILITFGVLTLGWHATTEIAQAQGRTAVTVTGVIDGDTIEISPAIDGRQDVRLIGVDTPETVDPRSEVQPYGPEASRFTKGELEGERVRLEFDQEREDQFGRLLAYVYDSEGELFNETLLSEGYAQLFIVTPNNRYEARLGAAQQEARDAQRGLWGLPESELCQLANRGNGIGEGSPGCANAPSASADRNCEDFPSQAAAQRELESDPADPNGLDANGDGQACEDFDYGTNAADQQDDNELPTKKEVIVETALDEPLPKTGGLPLGLGAIALLTGAASLFVRTLRP